ncbi:MAG: glucose-1-phosphate thymidylyltransferase RfbA [Elusimicrobiota bacterium]|jgi:glucose-1-phosphate thymidylyltransferase|nr:glucose-1-phosphate thymidylyltransferase RfbA [Elusimicrobiota bacterium]
MKGIILAGGLGTRLYPITKVVSKQLLPLYDKPMIYYSLSVLMLAKIRDVLVISTSKDLPLFKELFGNGEFIGMNFSYGVQETPGGLADAFIVGQDFIGDDVCAVVLGDNIFYGNGFRKLLERAKEKVENEKGAVIFGYYVKNPADYGVVCFGRKGEIVSIEEKPENPKSHYAVTGLYFYDNSVIEIAKNIKRSKRNEAEITAVNNAYLEKKVLSFLKLERGIAWFDVGTFDRLLEASTFVSTIQKRQGLVVACIEEIAYKNGWVSKESILKCAYKYKNSEYGSYLNSVVMEN